MCLHSVLNLSQVERVKKCRFSNTNKNQNCTKIALGKNTILLGFGYSTLTFMSKRAPSELTQAMHLFLTTQGTAAMEGATLGDDDQTPQARPTQAIWINATTGTHITVDPNPEWMAIHYTLDCAEDDPTLTEWQTRWAAEANRLDEVALDDTLTLQTMESAGRTTRTHRDPTKHTLWHYPTTIHQEALTQIKEALSLTLPDTHNAHQPGMFTIYWNFPTDTSMVPQVAEPPMPPTVTALAKAAQAMAHRESAPQDWTPNVLVQQRAHHNANRAQQAERQIHPPLHNKGGNLQPHSPGMVQFILEDHGDKQKGTEVQITHNLAHTHLNYIVPTSNALGTYGEARKSTYRPQADTEGTAYTMYTWARYGDLPAPIWHPDLSWHQALHGRRVPRQSIRPAGNTATGIHGNPSPLNIKDSALANARMPLIDTGCPAPDDTTHRQTWGTIRRALHHNINRDQATWIDQGSVTIKVGGWLNTLNPKKITQGGGALHTISRTPGHGWPLPRAAARGPPLRPPLPARPVPTIAPPTRPTPRCLPKHGNRRQRSVPHDRRHHGPRQPSQSGTPHGPGATTTQHRQTTAPVGVTRHTRPQARGPKRPRPRQGAATPHHERHGPTPSHPGGGKVLHRGGPDGQCHHPGGQHPGGHHRRVGRCRWPPHGT